MEASGFPAKGEPGERPWARIDLASVNSRAAAWLLDTMFGGILAAPFIVAMEAVGGAAHNTIEPLAFQLFALPLVVLAFALLVYFQGGPGGATPGMMVMGIRIVDKDLGGPIGYRRAVIRVFVYALGGWCLYLGWLWCLWDADRQTWQDKAARSVVVGGVPKRWSVALVIGTFLIAAGLAGALAAAFTGSSTGTIVPDLAIALVGVVGLILWPGRPTASS